LCNVTNITRPIRHHPLSQLPFLIHHSSLSQRLSPSRRDSQVHRRHHTLVWHMLLGANSTAISPSFLAKLIPILCVSSSRT
jgi:hypothetical protein